MTETWDRESIPLSPCARMREKIMILVAKITWKTEISLSTLVSTAQNTRNPIRKTCDLALQRRSFPRSFCMTTLICRGRIIIERVVCQRKWQLSLEWKRLSLITARVALVLTGKKRKFGFQFFSILFFPEVWPENVWLQSSELAQNLILKDLIHGLNWICIKTCTYLSCTSLSFSVWDNKGIFLHMQASHSPGGCFPLRYYGRKWPRRLLLSCRGKAGVSSQFLWCGSSYSICTTVWLQSRSVHGPTVTRALDKLQNPPFLIIWQGCWVFGGGVGASLHLCMVSPSTCTLYN